jgi:hypothetical protein
VNFLFFIMNLINFLGLGKKVVDKL